MSIPAPQIHPLTASFSFPSSQRLFLPSREDVLFEDVLFEDVLFEDVLFEPGLRIGRAAPGGTGTSVWWVTPETPA